MVFVEASFQSTDWLIDLVQGQEVVNRCLVRSKKVKNWRDLIKGKGVSGEGVGG